MTYDWQNHCEKKKSMIQSVWWAVPTLLLNSLVAYNYYGFHLIYGHVLFHFLCSERGVRQVVPKQRRAGIFIHTSFPLHKLRTPHHNRWSCCLRDTLNKLAVPRAQLASPWATTNAILEFKFQCRRRIYDG